MDLHNGAPRGVVLPISGNKITTSKNEPQYLRFLELPRELRDKVYRELTNTVPRIPIVTYGCPLRISMKVLYTHRLRLNVRLTSKQIRREYDEEVSHMAQLVIVCRDPSLCSIEGFIAHSLGAPDCILTVTKHVTLALRCVSLVELQRLFVRLPAMFQDLGHTFSALQSITVHLSTSRYFFEQGDRGDGLPHDTAEFFAEVHAASLDSKVKIQPKLYIENLLPGPRRYPSITRQDLDPVIAEIVRRCTAVLDDYVYTFEATVTRLPPGRHGLDVVAVECRKVAQDTAQTENPQSYSARR